MCGICGFVNKDGSCSNDDDRVLARMMDSIRHRGPDDEGFHVDNGAFLGHRRLSIIDVAGGRQPLFSENGDIAVVCNGEIYNHHRLRKQLAAEGHVLRTGSDCEVIAHLWESRGPSMLSLLDGMFALALWDSNRRQLLLARDRMGKKPLFWAPSVNGVVFGSELRSLMAHPDVSRTVSPESLYRYLSLDFVPTPRSMLQGVFKVEPGGFIICDAEGNTDGRYHELAPADDVTVDKADDAAEQIWTGLVDATCRRLESEVGLGVFLSGGLDSCAVLAAMASRVDPSTISTFTIGFDDPSFDESAPARATAKFFKTRHHEKILSGREALDLVTEIADITDEPLADYSILPTTLLSRFARQEISVALSGDGGDELFYGYETFAADRMARLARQLLPDFAIRRTLPFLARAIPVTDRNMGLDYKVDRMLRGLKYDRFERHPAWTGGFDPPTLTAADGVLSPATVSALEHAKNDWWPDVARVLSGSESLDPMKRLAIMYMRLYLLDGVLVKVDRASMSTALEVRSPFLDTRMVEVALALPPELNTGRVRSKAVIRKMLENRVPSQITGLPKKGFGVPVAAWLRTDLKPLVDHYLGRDHLKRQAIFNPEAVRRIVDSHMSKRHNYRKELFSLLVFQLWHERWI